jgi:hypothetical protein
MPFQSRAWFVDAVAVIKRRCLSIDRVQSMIVDKIIRPLRTTNMIHDENHRYVSFRYDPYKLATVFGRANQSVKGVYETAAKVLPDIPEDQCSHPVVETPLYYMRHFWISRLVVTPLQVHIREGLYRVGAW